jgi:hypothetical protein
MKFIINLKYFEQKLRLAAYPDRNKIILSYDEMLELKDALQHWETAEEQSDVY